MRFFITHVSIELIKPICYPPKKQCVCCDSGTVHGRLQKSMPARRRLQANINYSSEFEFTATVAVCARRSVLSG